MHFWTGVAMLGGAVRRRVWFDQGTFRWYPNFFIVFVAPPGVVKKTTTINIGFDLLRHVPKVKFAPDSVTWQRLYKFLSECEESMTYELNGRIIKDSMSAATAFIGELETFFRLGDDGFNGAMISMYDGRIEGMPLQHGTVGSMNASIVNPWLNLLGATTPNWIKMNVPESLIGGGLFSRIIFVCANAPRARIAYPKYFKGTVNPQLRDALIHDLCLISTMYGELVPTLELQEWGQKWYEEQDRLRDLHIASSRYDGYYSRKQSHVHKLAMMLHIARSSAMTLELEDVQKAIEMIRVAELSLQNVYESVSVVPETRHANELVSYVRAHKRITTQHLWSYVRNVMGERDFLAACQNARSSGLLTGINIDGVAYWTIPAPKDVI
jgi:hypothetical protein